MACMCVYIPSYIKTIQALKTKCVLGPHRSQQLDYLHDFFRAARVQNETAPEKFLNRYEKRFEKREKGSEKRSETRLKKILALSGLLKNVHRPFFTKF